MYSIDEKILQNILKKEFKCIVGNICERIEVKNINPKILKEIIFEVKKNNYNGMRNIENLIDSFSKGVNIKVDLYQPSS